MRGQPHQQPRKEILQRKPFTPPMNNVECYACHNFGHVAARCRSRMVQDHHTERTSHFRYFNGYCFSCNMFGHKAANCYRRNMKHVRCYVLSLRTIVHVYKVVHKFYIKLLSLVNRFIGICQFEI